MGKARPKTTRSRVRAAPAREPATMAPATGPKRYTAARFLSDCSEETAEFLRGQWAEGNQLFANRVPVDGLPPVLMLACYARVYGVELVDDYEVLVDRYRSYIKEFRHPDKFFSSCIALLHERDQWPEEESFETIKIPSIYEELLS